MLDDAAVDRASSTSWSSSARIRSPQFSAGGRTDLVDKESRRADGARGLPAAAPERRRDRRRGRAHRRRDSAPAGPGDMGKVMGAAKAQLAGKADMGLVSAAVKQALRVTHSRSAMTFAVQRAQRRRRRRRRSSTRQRWPKAAQAGFRASSTTVPTSKAAPASRPAPASKPQRAPPGCATRSCRSRPACQTPDEIAALCRACSSRTAEADPGVLPHAAPARASWYARRASAADRTSRLGARCPTRKHRTAAAVAASLESAALRRPRRAAARRFAQPVSEETPWPPLLHAVALIDRCTEFVGRWVAWLVLAAVLDQRGATPSCASCST